MSGHSKWSTIKRKKAKTDAQKGKAFSKVAKLIVSAVRKGGSDPDQNPTLRLAIQKAKSVNMPNTNIDRAIEKGAGNDDDENLEEITYEAYGPNGIAILIDTLTDNKNRTIPNIRAIITKRGGSMANKGAVSYLFDTKGLIVFDEGVNEDQVIEIATESGAEDIDLQSDGAIEVKTSIETLEAVSTAFDAQGVSYVSAEIVKLPQTTVEIDEETAKKIFAMVEQLEEDDDVQQVYANYTIDDATMATLVEASE